MGASNLLREEILSALQAAMAAGTEAGNAQIRKLAAQANSQTEWLDECGGSVLHLNVDGRSRLGRLLARVDEPNIMVSKVQGGFVVHMRYRLRLIPPLTGQEQSVYYEADTAAAEILEQRLGVPACAHGYID